MSPRARIADAGLDAVLGITLGIGTFTLLVLGVAIELCRKGHDALRHSASPSKRP